MRSVSPQFVPIVLSLTEDDNSINDDNGPVFVVGRGISPVSSKSADFSPSAGSGAGAGRWC